VDKPINFGNQEQQYGVSGTFWLGIRNPFSGYQEQPDPISN